MNDVKTDFLYLYRNVDYDAATSLGNVVTSSVEETKIYNEVMGSDHCPVGLTIKD